MKHDHTPSEVDREVTREWMREAIVITQKWLNEGKLEGTALNRELFRRIMYFTMDLCQMYLADEDAYNQADVAAIHQIFGLPHMCLDNELAFGLDEAITYLAGSAITAVLSGMCVFEVREMLHQWIEQCQEGELDGLIAGLIGDIEDGDDAPMFGAFSLN